MNEDRGDNGTRWENNGTLRGRAVGLGLDAVARLLLVLCGVDGGGYDTRRWFFLLPLHRRQQASLPEECTSLCIYSNITKRYTTPL